MRSNIVFRLILSAALTLCIAIIGQNIILSLFSGRINAALEDTMNQLSVSVVQKHRRLPRH